MGRAPCCDKAKVKRGPWSPEEDTILKNYLHTHGTVSNWIALPHKAGLRRCGKSCRLRWLNYLRPNIKHGGFTEEEDKIIFTLHSQMGSRWSLIASHLPGRTDNDVKNYWNTKLKKKLLLGGKTIINNNNNNNNNVNSPANYNNTNPNLSVSNHLPLPKPETNYCSLTFWDSLPDVGTSHFSFSENMELGANNLINNYSNNNNINIVSSSSSQEGSSCINIISDSSPVAGFEDSAYGLFPYYDDSIHAYNIGLLFEDKASEHHHQEVADSSNAVTKL